MHTIHGEPTEKEWRELARQASRETDPDVQISIVARLSRRTTHGVNEHFPEIRSESPKLQHVPIILVEFTDFPRSTLVRSLWQRAGDRISLRIAPELSDAFHEEPRIGSG